MKEIKPNRRIMLIKELKDLEIEVGYNLTVKLKHRKTGRDSIFCDFKKEIIDNESKREFLREFESYIKEKYLNGIKSKDMINIFVDFIREKWKDMFDNKVKEINELVYMCFVDEIKAVLSIGDTTKIRLKSFCTFEIIKAESFVSVIKED